MKSLHSHSNLQNGTIAKLTNAIDAAKAHAQKMQRNVNREITPSVQAQMVGMDGVVIPTG